MLYCKTTQNVYASEIANYLDRPMVGKDTSVHQVCGINSISDDALMFYTNMGNAKFGTKSDKKLELDEISEHSNIVLITYQEISTKVTCTCIISPNPKLDFVKAMRKFFVNISTEGIHPSAIINPYATIGKNVSIGSNSFIGPKVTIGDNTNILSNAVINGEVVIGNNSLIKSNATIGSEGFNYVYDEDGIPIHFPHIGRIIIGNNVVIGSNSSIERGVLDDVVISDNVKIDDLVQISHNVFIDENALICAGSIICGSAKIGKGCYIAPLTCVDVNVSLAEDVMVGSCSLVRKTVTDKGATIVGNPARRLR